MYKKTVFLLMPLFLISSQQCKAGKGKNCLKLISPAVLIYDTITKKQEKKDKDNQIQQNTKKEPSFKEGNKSEPKKEGVSPLVKTTIAVSVITAVAGAAYMVGRYSSEQPQGQAPLAAQPQAAPQPAAAQAFPAAQPQIHIVYSDDEEDQAYIHHRKRRRHNKEH